MQPSREGRVIREVRWVGQDERQGMEGGDERGACP